MDADRLSAWMTMISTTAEEEMDCDRLVEVAEQAVEAAAGGADIRQLIPLFALHLDHCEDCRDYFDTLVAFVGGSPAGWL